MLESTNLGCKCVFGWVVFKKKKLILSIRKGFVYFSTLNQTGLSK